MRFKTLVKLALVGAAVAALTACSDPEPAAPDWSAYAPAVRDRIEAAIEAADCEALQAEFDVASSHSATDLMRYLDAALRDVGCQG